MKKGDRKGDTAKPRRGRPTLYTDEAKRPTPVLVRLPPPFVRVIDQYSRIIKATRPATIRRMLAIASRHLDEAR